MTTMETGTLVGIELDCITKTCGSSAMAATPVSTETFHRELCAAGWAQKSTGWLCPSCKRAEG